MNPGVYIFDAQGSSGTGLTLKHTTLTDDGAGVTLVFTCTASGQPCNSSQWPSNMMSADSNSLVCATAPSHRTNSRFRDNGRSRHAPHRPRNSGNKLSSTLWANAANYFNGTVYVPTATLAGAGMQRPRRERHAECNYAIPVSAAFACRLSSTRYPWVGIQVWVARAVAFQAGQAGKSRSRSAAPSRLWTKQRCRRQIHFGREPRCGTLSGGSCSERREHGRGRGRSDDHRADTRRHGRLHGGFWPAFL